MTSINMKPWDDLQKAIDAGLIPKNMITFEQAKSEKIQAGIDEGEIPHNIIDSNCKGYLTPTEVWKDGWPVGEDWYCTTCGCTYTLSELLSYCEDDGSFEIEKYEYTRDYDLF